MLYQPAAALILDAHLKSSLAAIRSLGRRAIRVIAGSHRPFALGLHSSYVAEPFVYPSPLTDREGFIQSVIGTANRSANPVLFAFSDSTLLPLVDIPRRDARFKLLIPPSHDCFEAAFDKGRTLDLALAAGIEAPATYAEGTGGRLSAFLEKQSYPLVIKPRRTVYWDRSENGNSGVQVTATFAMTAQEVRSKCAAFLAQTGEFPLVQEYVAGEEASVQFLCDRGAVVAACANRRLRSVTPLGGPGSLKETIPLNYGGLAKRGERLASTLRWSGPIMVEFKIDRNTGVPKLMEINGRFWGSLPLAVLAGVDFPYLYYKLAQSQEIEPSMSYLPGIVSRHFVSDLQNLYSTLFKRDPMRATAYPKRLRALHDFIVLPKGCKSDVLDRDDWMPALAELVDTTSRVYSRKAQTPAKLSSEDLRRSTLS